MSKTVCQKNLCCGCNACINICPKQCIKLVDNIKELNAEIDKNKCINCKLCESVCQVVNEQSNLIKFNKTLNCFEGVTKDKVFWLICYNFRCGICKKWWLCCRNKKR